MFPFLWQFFLNKNVFRILYVLAYLNLDNILTNAKTKNKNSKNETSINHVWNLPFSWYLKVLWECLLRHVCICHLFFSVYFFRWFCFGKEKAFSLFEEFYFIYIFHQFCRWIYYLVEVSSPQSSESYSSKLYLLHFYFYFYSLWVRCLCLLIWELGEIRWGQKVGGGVRNDQISLWTLKHHQILEAQLWKLLNPWELIRALLIAICEHYWILENWFRHGSSPFLNAIEWFAHGSLPFESYWIPENWLVHGSSPL